MRVSATGRKPRKIAEYCVIAVLRNQYSAEQHYDCVLAQPGHPMWPTSNSD